jgi:Tol biopolymer transport system component
VSSDPGDDSISGQIAYVSGLEDPQIFLLDLQTGESQQLTDLRLEDAELTGEGPLRPALSCGFGPYSLTWSPDGSRLAFTYGSCDTVVFVLDLDGEIRRIGDGRSPTWSPDGSRLLYAANVPYQPCAGCQDPGAPGELELRIADVDGGWLPQPFTADGSTSLAGGPLYSPDGSVLAFSAPPQGAAQDVFSATYLIDADGSGVNHVADGGYPTGWLPDGRLLVSREEDQSIHAVDIETGESEQIGAPQTTSVSPDGTRSLVSTSDPVTGASGLRLVTGDGEIIGDTLGSFGAWAPNSGAFAVFGNDGGLHLVSRDGELLASYEVGASGGPAAWRPGS